MHAILLEDVKQECQELLRAIETLEKRYDGYYVQLVPKAGNNAPRTAAASQNGGKRSNRRIVADACISRAKAIADLAAETGLSKTQIRGVLNAPGETDSYEREELDDGSKLYKYVGE